MTQLRAKLCEWQDVRGEFNLNPQLGRLLGLQEQQAVAAARGSAKASKAAPKYPQVVRVQARYGAQIALNGSLDWDSLSGATTDDSPPIDWDKFRYADIPVCVVTKGSFEVWTEREALVGKDKRTEQLTVAHFVAQKGDLLGLFETLSPLHPPRWNVTSGVRSVFFAPPVGERKRITSFFKYLAPADDDLKELARLYTLGQDPGLKLSHHPLIVKDLLRNCSIDDWHSELLIFSIDFLRFLGFEKENNSRVSVVKPTLTADLLKTFTIEQLSGALQVHLSVSHDTGGHLFTAEKSAARIVAMAQDATPVFAPVPDTERDLLPAHKLSERFQKKAIHNPDQHHFVLFAAQSLSRSKYGYFSLHVPFAEFDWQRPISMTCLVEVARKLGEQEAALNGTQIRFYSSEGVFKDGNIEVSPLADSRFMKNAKDVSLAPSAPLTRPGAAVESPLSNPFFAYMVELEAKSTEKT